MVPDVLAGIVAGSGYAVLGLSIVFMWRLTRLVNVAAPALGAVGVFVMASAFDAGVPLGIAVAFGVLVGAGLSAAMGAGVSKAFEGADDSVKTSMAIAVLVGVVTLGSRITGQVPHRLPELWTSVAFRLAGVTITWATVVVLVLSGGLIGGLWLFLDRTILGLHLRATSESPLAAEALGINTRAMIALSWTATGALNAMAMILIAGSQSPDFISLSLLVIPALAAAVAGALRSLSRAFAGGIMLGITEGVCGRFPLVADYRNAVPFVAMLGFLLWSERHVRWDDAR